MASSTFNDNNKNNNIAEVTEWETSWYMTDLP